MQKMGLFLVWLPVMAFARVNVDDPTIIVHLQDGAQLITDSQINNFSGTLIKDSGASISGNIGFTEGTLNDAGNKAKMTGNVSNGQVTLDGAKVFSGQRGQAIDKIKVSGKNNRLEGVLQLSEDIELQDSDTELTFALSGRVPTNVALNGGSVYLEEDMHFVDDVFFTGSGVVDLNQRKILLGSSEMTSRASLYFDGAQDLELNANFHLAETWTFSGSNILQGNNKILYLEDGGNIVIEQGSGLLLQNMKIRGIVGNNIRCLDSSATLSVQNVIWSQDADYSFTIGALVVVDDLMLKGSSTFAYQSAQKSTIRRHASLIVDRGMTFSFDPIWNAGVNNWDKAKEFLVFRANTSVLELNGATLYVTTTGLKLTKGTLLVRDNSNVIVDFDGLYHEEEGLVIGDNDIASDMLCEIGGGGCFDITRGTLSYKNIDQYSWSMVNIGSCLCIESGARLRLHQDLNVEDGGLEFYENGILARAAGKRLIGSVHLAGPVSYEVCYN